MTDQELPGGDAAEVDYAEMPRPETLKDLSDDEWNATPPTVRKAVVDRENRSKVNHGEQIARLAGQLNAMQELLANREQPAATNGNGHAAKKPGIEGMELSELEAYQDLAETILARARAEPDNIEVQEKAKSLTPQVMREVMKAIARKSVGVSREDIESLRAEFKADKEAGRLNGALSAKMSSEFNQAALLPGNPQRLAAEKAYAQLQADMKDSGLSADAALQLAAYRIAGAGNRDGRSNGAEAGGNRRLADNGKPDVAGVLRSLKTRSAALRAKGDDLGAAKLEVESELFGSMPDNILNNGR